VCPVSSSVLDRPMPPAPQGARAGELY